MNDWSKLYRRIGSLPTETGQLEIWLSEQVTDSPWDDFLRHTPCGHYQQSSLWAEHKATEGWKSHRIILTGPAGIAGGFQLLWKQTRLVRIGYVNKGPVAHPPGAALAGQLKTLLRAAVRELGLVALVAQDPDETPVEPAPSTDGGFIASNPTRLIETTYLMDVSESMEIVRGRMRPGLRRDVRKAQRQGVTVREGSAADLPVFFRLMSATAARKQVAPSPASEQAFRELWRIFSPSKSVRLTIAEYQGNPVAGLFSLQFGDRVSIWKEGRDGSHPHLCEGTLLQDEMLEWAHHHHYRICDICSVSRATALHILSGKTVTPEAVSSRDWFNVRFGGYPKILAPARIYLPNPVLRWGYRHVLTRFARFR